jgi:NADPH:quinone reductase-like Zn-dependent oxidoreductase
MARACVVTEYGPPDVLKCKDVPTPEPSEGEIRIKVRVSGVSPTDLKIRHGNATLDAAGKGGLADAIALTGGSDRVITLADPRAAELGARFSVGTPDRAPDAVGIGMQLLAAGELRMRSQQSLPMSQAAEAHRLLENGHAREKFVLVTGAEVPT